MQRVLIIESKAKLVVLQENLTIKNYIYFIEFIKRLRTIVIKVCSEICENRIIDVTSLLLYAKSLLLNTILYIYLLL